MKVDRTKLKKTPTEAVSIQKFAVFFLFQKKILAISSSILIFQIDRHLYTKCSKTIKFSFELPLIKKVNKLSDQ